MGVDYTLVSTDGKASLYLDRGWPFRGPDMPDEDEIIAGDRLRQFADCERYGRGWVEAVAQWVDRHGPAYLLDDVGQESGQRLAEVWMAWERGEHDRYDVGRFQGERCTSRVRPFDPSRERSLGTWVGAKG